MKKLLISMIAVLLVILTAITMIKGWSIGGLSVLGIKGIRQKNEELDSKIQAATKLANTDYLKSIDNMNENLKKLEEERENYENIVSTSTESEVQNAKQFQKYPIEYLWIQIGQHAKNEGVEIKIVVAKGTSNTENTYNLNFTATGGYAEIAEFIRDIEDDSSLGFRIEEFKMSPNGTENNLQATFVCKNITIKDIAQTSITSQTETTESNTTNQSNTTTANTTNTNNITTTTTNNVTK